PVLLGSWRLPCPGGAACRGRRRAPVPGDPDARRRRRSRGERRARRRASVGSVRPGGQRAPASRTERRAPARGQHAGQPAERAGAAIRSGGDPQAARRRASRAPVGRTGGSVMVRLAAEPLSAEAFAPFGRVVQRPLRPHDAAGPGWRWWAETAGLAGDGRPWGIGYLDLEPAPLRFDWAERHLRTLEAILPTARDILVYVGPAEHP